ncbi:hypothetical protein TNCV_2605951 [Trichonephila clavipes]|nr:hypothetical protein TNCV_2605951 [Trichonephila clavipes]
MTAMADSDVVQSGRPIFDDFFQICGRISAITRRMLSSNRLSSVKRTRLHGQLSSFCALCTNVNGGVGGQLSTGGNVQDGGRTGPLCEGVWPQFQVLLSNKEGLKWILGGYLCLFLLKDPSFNFPKGHNGKSPTGRQPLLEFCLAAPCKPGLGNFCLGYLPRPERKNLNQMKLQPYQEWRDEQKADEGPNEWSRFHRHNELYESST